MIADNDGDRIKSAYEKAMERAEDMIEDTEGSINYERREEIKPKLSRYFQGGIDSDELWQEFSGAEEDELKMAQEMIIESLGLNSSEEEIEKRRQAVLALEDLKDSSQVRTAERALDQASKVVQQYNSEQERLRSKLKDMMRQQMQDQQQRGQLNGDAVTMQAVQNMDEETRRRIARTREQMENKFQEQWDEVKGQLLDALGLEK
ncbi:hypothetical protein [Halarsenatibacter silvermanii]|uniref:Uncharacterized protein n=1 Tax=Halarsenatibacter silvermanii TaxID=321763 RepID=A0A1G9H6N0_9FIRM|nr:hypothetical protein [Halarsenatibacter silvermanii]SDL08542.1 hypothetical protein SAMN04488692_101117 [Halarsenatibacter silvermanii]